MIKKFRKKPVIIEAIQWIGNNLKEIERFVDKKLEVRHISYLIIPTLEGEMTASTGDWIIQGVHGEFYPCKPDIFEETYEEVLNENS